MKGIRALLPVMLVLATAVQARAQAAPAGFRAEFLRQLNNSAQKFIALAEAMPAERDRWSRSPQEPQEPGRG